MIADKLATAMKHHQAGELSQAEGLYREILSQQPNHSDALHLLGVLARQTGRVDLAIRSIAKAVEINARNPAFYCNLANALRDRGRLDQAIAQYQRALELDPHFAEARLNLGAVFEEQGRLAEALAEYDLGLSQRPDDFQARLVCGMLRLQMGNLENGWREYEWRWRLERGTMLRALPHPFWEGEDLQDATLLVHPESSLCDQVMFASCYPDLMQRTGHCIFLCDPRLALSLTRSFPHATVHSADGIGNDRWPARVREVDWRIAAGSVPRLLRRNWSEFPARRGYFRPDPERRQRYWAQLNSRGGGLKVGISWRSAEGGDRRQPPRDTLLADWRPVLNVPFVRFVNLEPGDCREEVANAAESAATDLAADLGDAWRHDLDERAALISALDLVVTAPNLTAHLAGALGVPVWNVLAHWSSWRWFIDREDSPWYPSMRLFRQRHRGQWSDVFERVARQLAALVANPRRPAA